MEPTTTDEGFVCRQVAGGSWVARIGPASGLSGCGQTMREAKIALYQNMLDVAMTALRHLRPETKPATGRT